MQMLAQDLCAVAAGENPGAAAQPLAARKMQLDRRSHWPFLAEAEAMTSFMRKSWTASTPFRCLCQTAGTRMIWQHEASGSIMLPMLTKSGEETFLE